MLASQCRRMHGCAQVNASLDFLVALSHLRSVMMAKQAPCSGFKG